MKRLDLPCDFGEHHGRARVLVGRPAPGFGPLHFQAAWLREELGGELLEENAESSPPSELRSLGREEKTPDEQETESQCRDRRGEDQ